MATNTAVLPGVYGQIALYPIKQTLFAQGQGSAVAIVRAPIIQSANHHLFLIPTPLFKKSVFNILKIDILSTLTKNR